MSHITPRFDLVCSVENHMSSPAARLTSAQAMRSHEHILKRIRFLAKMALGMETRKVTNISPALKKATRLDISLDQTKRNGIRQSGRLPVSGVFCKRSFAAALTVIDMPDILGWKMIATASKRGPVRRKSRSKTKKVRRILLAMVASGPPLGMDFRDVCRDLALGHDRCCKKHKRETERKRTRRKTIALCPDGRLEAMNRKSFGGSWRRIRRGEKGGRFTVKSRARYQISGA